MANDINNKYIITPQYLPVPSKRRSGLKISEVKFLVAHDTGNPGSTAAQNVKYYTNSCNQQSSSAHLFVDDQQIIECVPALTATPEKAWHVLYNVPKDNQLFGANANDAAIGVEYCYGGKIDADKAYDKYVWLLARLCMQFNLDPAHHIVGHYFLDPQRKTDPVTGLLASRRSMEQLIRDVVAEVALLEGQPADIPMEEPLQATGTVNTKLNLRSSPNTRAAVAQVLTAGATINLVARTTAGEPINNNSVWYKDSNNRWLWSGGLTVTRT